MSSIDQRIVEMQFKNSEFESGIKQSLKSLDKLKKGLNFDDSSKSMDKLQKAGNSFSLASMAQNVENIANKFTMLGRIGMKAMDDIASYAYNTGKRLVKSLSVDQITAGWTKYGEKTSSVQTIMNATGDSIDTVNGYLDKLMWFSDETSYNFTEMTAALGTLTSSGGEVKKLIPMIEGMATATAFAGKTSSEFSRVIYNLNQSYSQGYLSLMDWKSVELAQVGSEQLKQTLIDTAVELGTLKKASDGTYKTLKGTLVTAGNMGSTLNEKWATREVMEGGFGKFASVMEEAYKLVEAGEFDTASDAIASLEGKFDDIYFKAAKAAQEAKSFGEAIEATKDAVSSGWMKSFELIFGNYEEAKEMWTDLANALWDVFASGGEARNEMLQAWHDAGGRADLLQGIYDALEGLWGIVLAVKDAFADIFPPITVDTLLKMSSAVKEFGANLKYLLRYREILTGMEDVALETPKEELEEFNNELKKGAKGDDVKKLQERLTELGYDVGPAGTDGIFGPKTLEALKKFQEDYGLTVDGIYNSDVHNKLGEALGASGITEQLKKSAVYTLVFGDALKRVQRIAKGFFAVIKIGWNALKFLWNIVKVIADALSPLADVFLTLGAALGDWFVNLQKSMEQSEWFAKALDKVKNFFAPLKNWVTKAGESILNFFGLGKEADKTTGKMKTFNEWWTRIRDNVKNSKVWGNIKTALEKLREAFTKMIAPIKEWWKNLRGGDKEDGEPTFLEKTAEKIPLVLEKIGNAFAKFLAWITPFIEKVPEYAAKVKQFFAAIFEDIKGSQFFNNAWTKIKDFFSSIWASIKKWFGFGDNTITGQAADKINGVLNSVGGIVDTVNSVFGKENTLGEAEGNAKTVSAAWEKIKSIATAIVESIKNFFTTTMASIGDFLSKNAWWMLSAGVIVGLVVLVVKIVKSINTLIANLAILKGKEPEKKANIGDTLLKIAGSLAILAGAIWILGSMDPAKLKRGAIAFGGIVGALMLFMVISAILTKKKLADGVASVGKSMFQLSIGIAAIAGAIWLLGSMKTSTLLKGGAAVIGLLLAFFLFLKFVGNVSVSLKGFMSLAGAIAMLALIVKMIGGMKTSKLVKGLIGLTVIMALMTGFMLSMKFIGSSEISLKGFLGLAAAITMMALVAKILGGMKTTDFLQGMIGLVAIMALLAGFVYVMGKVGTGADFGSSTGMLLALSAFIWVFGQVLDQVKDIDPKTMLSFASSLALALGALVGACLVANKFGGGVGGMAKGALGISAAIGIVATAITGIVWALGEIDELSDGKFKETLQNGAEVIGTIGGAIDQLSDSLKITLGAIVLASQALAIFVPKGAIGKALKGAVIAGIITASIDLVVVVLGALVAGLGELDKYTNGNLAADIANGGEVLRALSEALKPFNSDMGIAILAIVGLSEVLAYVPGGVLAAAKGLAISTLISSAIGMVVIVVTGLVAAIGALDEATDGGVLDTVTRGGEVLEQVGTAIGRFFGGFQEGTMVAISNGLKKFEEADIDTEKVTKCIEAATGIADLSNGLNQITFSEAVGDLIAGDSSFSRFIKAIPQFALSMKIAGAFLSGLNTGVVDNVGTAVTAATNFKELYETFDDSNGIFGSLNDVIGNWLKGGSPFETFCSSMAPFATAINTLGDGLKDLDANALSNVEVAIEAAKNVAAFMTALNGGGEDGEGYDIEKNKNSILAWFTGDGSVGTLIDQVPKLGTAIKLLHTEIAGFSDSSLEDDATTLDSVIRTMAGILTMLNSDDADIQRSVDDGGALFDKITDFQMQLETLGTAISEFDTNTKDVDLEHFKSISDRFNELIGGMSLASSTGDFTGISAAIESLTKLFSGEGKDSLSNENFLKNLDANDIVNRLNSFTEQVGSSLTQNSATLTGYVDSFNQAGSILASSMASGMGQSVDTSGAVGAAEACLSAIKAYTGKFQTVGADMARGLANGLKNNAGIVSQAARSVAQKALNSAKEAIDSHSPSKKFEELGMYSDQGFAVGLSKYSRVVSDASKSVATTMLDSAKGGLATLNSIVTDSMDGDPVVRPVIDLSDVQSGAKTINGLFGSRSTITAKATIDNAAATASSIAKAKNIQNGSKESNADSGITNTDSSVNLSGNNFYVRSEQDIHSLASEIASLTRQQQRGLGAGY